MSEFQSLRYRKFCFHVYRSADMFAQWLLRIGAWRTSEVVYWLIPMNVCNIGYDIWKTQYPEDFDARMDFSRGGSHD